jgi:prenylcysteine oxidase/farnesylcysteine lyase
MESFISTMETNALMGMNVARLIANDILGMITKTQQFVGDSEQNILRGETHGTSSDDVQPDTGKEL